MGTNMTLEKRRIKYWWISIIAGLLAIAVGIMSSLEPIVTIGVLTIFFIASFLTTGVIDIVFSLANTKNSPDWGWTLVGGILNLVFAFILLALPIANMAIFVYYVSFYIMIQSIMQICISFSLKRYNLKSWLLFLVLGIAGLILSLIMVFKVEIAISFITFIFAAALICYGLFRILYGIRLRKLKTEFDKL